MAFHKRRSNQSVLKEINPKYSLEGLNTLEVHWKYIGSSNTLATWYRANSLKKTLMLRKIEGDDSEWDGWMASPIQWSWVWTKSGRQWRTGKPGVLQSMESQRVQHDLATEQKLGRTFLREVLHFLKKFPIYPKVSDYLPGTYSSRCCTTLRNTTES